jgi:hypothetical protein
MTQVTVTIVKIIFKMMSKNKEIYKGKLNHALWEIIGFVNG